MEEEDIKPYLDKYIKLILKDNTILSGYIKSLNNKSIYFTDKYNSSCVIDISQIGCIMEIKHG